MQAVILLGTQHRCGATRINKRHLQRKPLFEYPLPAYAYITGTRVPRVPGDDQHLGVKASDDSDRISHSGCIVPFPTMPLYWVPGYPEVPGYKAKDRSAIINSAKRETRSIPG
eukprot:3301424-Rhodomonas_salina.1